MKRLWLWGPVVLYMAFLFTASSTPDIGEFPGGMSDKMAHVLAFALLAVLVLRALAEGRWEGITVTRAGAAALLSILYGMSDEVHQRFVPGRHSDLADLIADALGAVGGVALVIAALYVFRPLKSTPR